MQYNDGLKKETKKALDSFSVAITYSEKNFDDSTLHMLLQNATIQSFEYSTEIFWKLLKQYLQEYSKVNVEEIQSPRSILKMSMQAKLMSKEELSLFMKMIDDRNRTSHLYSQIAAEKIYRNCKDYYAFMDTIFNRL